jgi:hypothetical protein
MASKKHLILRSAPGVNRAARLEGRTVPISIWTAGVSPAAMRPGRPRSFKRRLCYVDALIAAAAIIAICLTAWGALAQASAYF